MPLFPCFERTGIAAAIVLGAVTATRVASADPENEAKDLFARAREMRTASDCAGAVPLFRKAYKIYPNGLGSLRNVAECEEQIGHYASSRRAWLDIKRALVTMAQDPKYDGWEKDAQDAAARLQPKVATVFVDVIVKSPQGEVPANDKSGVEVFVNGESLGTNLVGTPLERDPGNYKVRVQAQYAEAVEQDVSLVAGDAKHMTLRIVQTPPVAPPQEVDTGNGKRTTGIILMGVGGAALLGSVITFAVRGGAKSDLDGACASHTNCDPSLRDTVDKGKLMSTLTTVFLISGGVLVAGGAGVFIWGLSSKEQGPPPQAAGFQNVRVSGGLGQVGATWRF